MHAFIPKSQLDSVWQQYCIYCNTHIQFRTQKPSLGLILGCLKANKPYTSRIRFFRKAGSSYRRSGEDRDRSRSAPSSTVTRPSKSENGQATMTVTVPQEPKIRQVQTHEGAPRSKRQR